MFLITANTIPFPLRPANDNEKKKKGHFFFFFVIILFQVYLFFKFHSQIKLFG